jgi:hypothetical protein
MKRSQTAQSGRRLRHKKAISKLTSKGIGCPWKGNSVVFRVEMAWENKLGEQSNFQLHWISVRRFAKEEKQKYLKHFRESGSSLNMSLELSHLVAYLDGYYQEQIYLKPDQPQVNQAFIFPAKKINDNTIRYPIARRIWNKKEFVVEPLNKDILASYRNTIFHYGKTLS